MRKVVGQKESPGVKDKPKKPPSGKPEESPYEPKAVSAEKIAVGKLVRRVKQEGRGAGPLSINSETRPTNERAVKSCPQRKKKESKKGSA